MFNLIKSDFYKMKKSRAFWVCTVICCLFGLMVVFATNQGVALAKLPGADGDLKTFLDKEPFLGGAWIIGDSLSQGLHAMLFAIFTAIFVSAEFQFGTMKNTVSRGADRVKVYCSKVLVCSSASLIMLFGYMAACGLSGTALWGWDPNQAVNPAALAGVLLAQAVLTVAYTSFFVFISMVIRSSGGAIAVNVLSVLVGSTIINAVSMLFGSPVDLTQFWIGGAVSSLGTITPAAGLITKGLAVGLVYAAAAFLVGSSLFRKQDIK